MISNIPDFEELRDLAVRAYFVAWKEATSLFEWIEEAGTISFEVNDEKLVATSGDDESLTVEESAENLEKYEQIMQHKLQLIYSLIQHSQELALKSYICEASPFLLLVGSDIKSWAREKADFIDLKTIDASDLVRVVTAVSELNISESFKNTIEDVRRGRNSIQHLGKHARIGLLEPIRILTRQYIELFPGRNWLQDLRDSEDTGRYEIFYFDDDSGQHVFHQLSMLHRLTTKRQAKAVLGMEDSSTAYECLDCIATSDFDHQGLDVSSVERKKGTRTGVCKLCGTSFALRHRKCEHCGCDVVFGDGEHKGHCCGCGHDG